MNFLQRAGFHPARFFAGTLMLRRHILFFLPLFLMACTHFTPPQRVIADINADEYWSGRVEIDGDVVISRDAVLRIAPGSQIIFLPPSAGQDRLVDHPNFVGSELIVQGRIIAEGTVQAPITFSALDPAAPAGSWGAINLVQSEGSSFRHCRFLQADSAIHSQESNLEISCSTFSRNLVGVRFFGSQIEISDNLFSDNATAIRFHFGAPYIHGNLLRNNGKGIFVTSFPNDYRIVDNTIIASREFQVVLGEEVPDDLLLSGNYWGSIDPLMISRDFYDGQQSSYLGMVRFKPFLQRPIADPESRCNR